MRRPGKFRRGMGAAVVAAAVLAIAPSAIAAQHHSVKASVKTSARHAVPGRVGRILGILPNSAGRHARTFACSTPPQCSPPLTYHDGPVQTASRVYTVFWQPKGYYMPPGYQQTVNQFFKDVAKQSYTRKNVYAASTQYWENVGGHHRFVQYNVSFGKSTLDTHALPSGGCSNYQLFSGEHTKICLTDAQLQHEIGRVVAAKNWKKGLGTEIFLFTPPLVGSCAGSLCYDAQSGGYCAYHSWTSAAKTILYANMPYADLDGCRDTNSPYPNGSAADPVLNVTSHEHNETLTDPTGEGWWDVNGFENGDECAWFFGNHVKNNGWGPFNQVINGSDYYLQLEWSNRANDCVAGNSHTAPSVTLRVSPHTPTHGHSATLSAHATQGSGFYYQWFFGDGKRKVTDSSSVKHTYKHKGKVKASVVAITNHGDQTRVSKTITIK